MKTILATAALLTLSAPAFAQSKITLPIGSWGLLLDIPNSAPICRPKPFLVISDKMITINLQSGQGHCRIKSLKKIKGVLDGNFKCVWDKSIPPEEIVFGDENEDEFSIAIKSTDRMLYNNSLHGRCPEVSAERQ